MKQPSKKLKGHLEKADLSDQPTKAPENFAVKYTQMRFLIAVCLTEPRIWHEIKREYYGRYLALVREQSETREREWDEEWDLDWAEVREKTPDFEQRWAEAIQRKEARMKERRKQADLNSNPIHSRIDRKQQATEGARQMPSGLEGAAYDFHLKEVSKVPKDYSHLRPPKFDNLSSTPTGFLELEGNDPEVERFQQDLLEHTKKCGLGEHWCGEYLIHTMRRQESPSTADTHPDQPRSRPRRRSAWMKRFDDFIAQLDSEFEEFGEVGKIDPAERQQVLAAWRVEWESQSHFRIDRRIKVRPPRGYPSWNANVESRAEYLEAIERAGDDLISKILPLQLLTGKQRATFKDWLKEKVVKYCDNLVEELSSIPEWKQVETKRKLVKHIVWTSWYQVRAKRYADVAFKARVTDSTAKREIEQVLDIINLRNHRAKNPTGNDHRRR